MAEKKDFTQNRKKIKFIDLFAGAGGISEGFLQAYTDDKYFDFVLASDINENCEFFKYKKIEHTKNPNIGQLDILLQQSTISVDLLLCRPSGHGDTYSFKIKKKGMPLLFPQSEIYLL